MRKGNNSKKELEELAERIEFPKDRDMTEEEKYQLVESIDDRACMQYYPCSILYRSYRIQCVKEEVIRLGGRIRPLG